MISSLCSHHMTSPKGGLSGAVPLQEKRQIVMTVLRFPQVLSNHKELCSCDDSEVPTRLGNGACPLTDPPPEPRMKPSSTLRATVEKTMTWTSDLGGFQQMGRLCRVRKHLCMQSWPRSTPGVQGKVEQIVRVFHVAGPPCRLSLTHTVKVDGARCEQRQDEVLTRCRR